MSGFLKVETAPSALVSIAEVKAQTRVTSTSEDTLLGDYISAASALIDGPYGMAGRVLSAQAWTYTIERFCPELLVPVPGSDAVDSISYYDSEGVEQSLTAGDYFYIIERDDGLLLQLKDGVQLPTTKRRNDAVAITVSNTGAVSETIKQAALLTITTWFQEREMGGVPEGAKMLIDIERSGWVAA